LTTNTTERDDQATAENDRKKRNVKNTGELLATVKGWSPDTLNLMVYQMFSATSSGSFNRGAATPLFPPL
jgi:hypothetical protein